ncbi:MAG: phosphatidylserine decarboxylase family protein [Deltaproteobacteria bacterium]|nr:phosphatidylserine decarboxylase family protein [Deltaproteobacteria bacterium]
MDEFTKVESTSLSAFPIAKAGYPFIGAAAVTTIILAILGLKFLTLFALVVTFFICFFFRDPDRYIPEKNDAVVSPADGRVILAEKVDKNPFLDGECIKVSIFMNIFNVHVNRNPFSGSIEKIKYHPGKFFTANLDKASKDNEQNALLLDIEGGKRICFVQIAGFVARRIICYVNEGDRVKRGQRFGLICFGSRLDVYLPSETKINVTVGDKVNAGTSILGYLT